MLDENYIKLNNTFRSDNKQTNFVKYLDRFECSVW